MACVRMARRAYHRRFATMVAGCWNLSPELACAVISQDDAEMIRAQTILYDETPWLTGCRWQAPRPARSFEIG